MIESIRSCPLFFELHANEINKVLKDAVVVSFDEGAEIIRQGDASDDLFVLLDGKVDVLREVNGHSVQVTQLHRGAVFGETVVLDDGRRQFTIQAVNKCDVLVINREIIFSMYRRNKDTFGIIMLNLSRILTLRLAVINAGGSDKKLAA